MIRGSNNALLQCQLNVNKGDILESYQFMIQESHKKNKLLPVKVQVNTDFWSWNKKITENDEIGRE